MHAGRQSGLARPAQPDAARFAEYAPKVRAIVDKAEASAKTALEPYAAAMDKADVWGFAGASFALQGVCKGAPTGEPVIGLRAGLDGPRGTWQGRPAPRQRRSDVAGARDGYQARLFRRV